MRSKTARSETAALRDLPRTRNEIRGFRPPGCERRDKRFRSLLTSDSEMV